MGEWEGLARPTSIGFPNDDLSGHTLVPAGRGLGVGVQVWVPREGCRWGRVLLRRSGESGYAIVGEPEPEHSDVDLIGCDGPWVFFLRQVGSMTPIGWGFSGAKVIRVDVETGTCAAFRSDNVDGGRRTISSLHGATPDGSAVYARCCTRDASAQYLFAEVNLADGAIRPIVELRSAFV